MLYRLIDTRSKKYTAITRWRVQGIAKCCNMDDGRIASCEMAHVDAGSTCGTLHLHLPKDQVKLHSPDNLNDKLKTYRSENAKTLKKMYQDFVISLVNRMASSTAPPLSICRLSVTQLTLRNEKNHMYVESHRCADSPVCGFCPFGERNLARSLLVAPRHSRCSYICNHRTFRAVDGASYPNEVPRRPCELGVRPNSGIASTMVY